MIKIDLEHNLSSLKIPELRVDPQSTILALKENIQRRYGSEPPYLRLILKSKKGQVITNMDQDLRSLDFYGIQPGMIVLIMDLNPNSIHKDIENSNSVEKYTMSEESYMELPQNFRKWKHGFLVENPQIKNTLTGQTEICDPNYLKNLAETMCVGMRCQLQNGSRGQIKYIGKIIDIGYGYYIGIELDEANQGLGNGIIEGTTYFNCQNGKAFYQRPNKIEVGEFPKIEDNDEI